MRIKTRIQVKGRIVTMKKILVILTVLLCLCALPASDTFLKLGEFPPVVVDTYPLSGSNFVSHKTKQIKVTFSKVI